MGEKQKYLTKSFSYEGLFNYRELFRVMDVWFREKFFDKFEKRTEQYELPDGIALDFEFTPWKKVTDYFKIIIKVELTGKGIKEVDVEINGKKTKVQEGKINVKLTGYVVVDYDGKWSKPLLYFLRDIYDKYVYWHITKKYIHMAVDDVNSLYDHMRTYLNMAQYKVLR